MREKPWGIRARIQPLQLNPNLNTMEGEEGKGGREIGDGGRDLGWGLELGMRSWVVLRRTRVGGLLEVGGGGVRDCTKSELSCFVYFGSCKLVLRCNWRGVEG